MSNEEKDKTINDLRQWMEVVENDDDYGKMGAALRRIRNWDPTGGDPMPYRFEVGDWRERYGPPGGAIEGESIVSGTGKIPVPVAAVDTPPPAAPEPPPDPDDHLQQLFDNAQAMLDGGAFYEAMKGFESVAKRAEGRLRQPAEERQFQAKAELGRIKQPLIAIARAAAPGASGAAWADVLAVDPEDADAIAAQATLQSRGNIDRIHAEIEKIRNTMERAVDNRNLPGLNTLVGEVDSLRRGNTADELRGPLDDLMQEVTGKRDELRANLGSPSTLIATGNNREAYSRARKLLEERIPTIVDTAGIMGGEPGAEVETIRFLGKAREIYLAGLNKFASDRLTVAESEQVGDPTAALDTLNEVVAALTDEILTNDDRGHLQNNLEIVEKRIRSVENLIRLYNEARNLVVAAGEPQLPADEKYQLLVKAQEIYQDYPGIADLKSGALVAVSAAAAAVLEGQIALAKTELRNDNFNGARAILDAARGVATAKVPRPDPGSPLDQRLAEVRELEDKIAVAEVAYKNLLERLEAVRKLIADEDQVRRRDNLAEARRRLESLTPADTERVFVDELWGDLRRAEGLDSNLTEGRRAYEQGQWPMAIKELSLVVASNHVSRAEAMTLVGRAEGAQLVKDGRAAENEHRYAEAIDAYNSGLEKLRTYQTDSHTEAALRAATSAIDRLKPYVEADEIVSRKRDAAMLQLAQVEAITESRLGKPSLLDPNPGYKAVVEALIAAAKQPHTTLGPQLEADLQKATSQWEEAYSAGMELAARSGEVDDLRKGIALGEELEENKLLSRSTHRELLRRLRENYLDQQYLRLHGDRSTDPQLIEDNRRERLKYTPLEAADRNNVETQLSEAVAVRVIKVMGDERNADPADGAEAALKYLSQEIARPEVYGSRDLFQELMQLLWEEERWDEARREAEKLRFRQLAHPTELRQLWLDLTDGAELMAANKVKAFDNKMDNLRQWFAAGGDATPAPATGETARRIPVWFADRNERLAYLDGQEAQLKNNRKRKLVRQAQQAEAANNYLKAAQLYAHAGAWASGDREVKSGLESVGRHLDAELRTLLTSAAGVTIQTASLSASIENAEDIQRRLLDIHGVSQLLGLAPPISKQLLDAAQALGERMNGWQQVDSLLNQIDSEVKAALRNPSEFRDDQGGWNLSPIMNRFTAVTKLANEQAADRNDLNTVISSRRNAVNELDNDAATLNEAVKDFLKAYDKEDFGDVVTKGGSLDRLWDARQPDGFGGLDSLIARRPYVGTGELRTLKAHVAAARTQEVNLQRWRAWADKAGAAHKAMDEAVAFLDRSLDELRNEKSLAELKDDCDTALNLMNQFLAAAGKKPTDNPLSRAATAERDRVPESWSDDLMDAEKEGPRHKVLEKKAEIERDIDKLAGSNGPLQQLITAMKQLDNAHDRAQAGRNGGILGRNRRIGISKQLFKNAEDSLNICRVLDPSNSDVVQAGLRLEALKNLYP